MQKELDPGLRLLHAEWHWDSNHLTEILRLLPSFVFGSVAIKITLSKEASIFAERDVCGDGHRPCGRLLSIGEICCLHELCRDWGMQS